MRRSPIKPGTKGLTRSAPMSRGSSQLARSPMQPGSKGLKRASKPMQAVGQRAKRTGQGKVAPTTAERAWMDQAAAFGCIVCWLQHGVRTPAAIHHILAGGRRMGHLFTIPLCDPGHHQGGASTGPFISRHPWKARFDAAYGTELELLDRLRLLLNYGAGK